VDMIKNSLYIKHYACLITYLATSPLGGNRSTRGKPTTFGRVLTDQGIF
jgi:hypothetical protein